MANVAWSLRSADAADEATVKKMIRDARLNPLGLDWRRFVVAVDDAGQVIGVVQVKPHGDGTRELASLAVLPSWQGRGVGGALVEAVLAREPGPVYLTCRSDLEGYYTRFGFRPLSGSELTPYFRRLARVVNAFTALGRLFGRPTHLSVMRRP